MAGAEDAVEEEDGEAEGPDGHEDSDEDLARGGGLGEGDGCDGEDGEVGASREV